MPGGRRPVRGHARRRAAAGGAAAARRAPSRQPACPARRRRSPRSPPVGTRPAAGRARARGRTTRPGRRSSPGWRPGEAPRAVWTALPGPGWAGRRRRTPSPRPSRRAAGRSSSCPTAATSTLVERVARRGASGRAGTPGWRPTSGPAARYRAFLAVLRGQAPGSSSAPGRRRSRRSRDLGPGRDLGRRRRPHAEPRAPYPHAREVLALRAELDGRRRAGRRVVAHRRGGARWSSTAGPARSRPTGPCAGAELAAGRGSPTRRPGRRPAGRRAARMPGAGLAGRRTTACRAARCWSRCRGRLPAAAWPARPAGDRPGARTARPAAAAAAATGRRGGPGVRAGAGGAAGLDLPALRGPAAARPVGGRRPDRGGARPGLPRGDASSSRRAGRALPAVPAAPALVLATPGVEPSAAGGYAAALLLDGDTLLGRPDLRAAEEALRRWRAAAALVRPPSAGGVVVALRPTRRRRPCRRWCGGTRPGTPRASWPSGASWGCRRRPRWPRVTGDPAAVAACSSARSSCPARSAVLGPGRRCRRRGRRAPARTDAGAACSAASRARRCGARRRGAC